MTNFAAKGVVGCEYQLELWKIFIDFWKVGGKYCGKNVL